MPKTKTLKTKVTKEKLKKLIESVSFIDKQEKTEWLQMTEDMNQQEINKTYAYFSDSEKELRVKELELLFENNLAKDYQKHINKISNKYINKLKILK